MPIDSKQENTRAMHEGTAGRVFRLLEETSDWRSGEEMSGIIGVSRAAIAKHVASLRRSGHIIDSSTKRGYRLLVRHVPVSREGVERHLETDVLGRTGWRVLSSTDSTNTEAITWALAGAEEGSLVTAEQQTGGKSRKGSDWFSSPRSLQFSLILRPRNDDDRIMGHAANALASAIVKTTGLPAATKSPNDVIVNGKKVAGVLVESGLRAGQRDWQVVGVGCNGNVPVDEFPLPLRPRITSLYVETGQAVCLDRILAAFLNALETSLI